MSANASRASGGVYPRRAAMPAGINPAARQGVLLFALLAAFVFASRAQSEPDDDDNEDVPQQAAPAMQLGFRDDQLDQWIFQNNGNFAGARRRLDTLLALQTEDIDRACKLTDAQKKKLELSGRGDIKRFFDLYEKVKQKFLLVKNDQQKMQQIWQDINPLQVMLQTGLFHEESFLGKSLHNTLTAEQLRRYDLVARERRAFRHRANVELAVSVLEQSMPLRKAQRRELISLLSNLTKPPRKSGDQGYYVIMYQLSQLPERKLKPLFDDVEWKVLNRQFNQFRGMRQWLKQSGQLPDEGDS